MTAFDSSARVGYNEGNRLAEPFDYACPEHSRKAHDEALALRDRGERHVNFHTCR